MDKLPLGGQAIIEGVLVRSPHYNSISVRNPKGKIISKVEKFETKAKKGSFFGLPLVRGVIVMWEMLKIGFGAVNYSANIAIEEEEKSFSWKEMAVSIFFALVFLIVFFKFIPFAASQFIYDRIGDEGSNWIIANLLEGIFKGVIFFLFLALMLFLGDMKRVFEYHGAEHMSIHAYEAGKKLTVANVSKFDPKHPRCGTSFLILVIFISILIYSFLPRGLPIFTAFGFRILALPVIAGISYEILKISSKHITNPFFKLLAYPGLLTQHITTQKPSKDQIQVAISSVEGALKKESSGRRTPRKRR